MCNTICGGYGWLMEIVFDPGWIWGFARFRRRAGPEFSSDPGGSKRASISGSVLIFRGHRWILRESVQKESKDEQRLVAAEQIARRRSIGSINFRISRPQDSEQHVGRKPETNNLYQHRDGVHGIANGQFLGRHRFPGGK